MSDKTNKAIVWDALDRAYPYTLRPGGGLAAAADAVLAALEAAGRLAGESTYDPDEESVPLQVAYDGLKAEYAEFRKESCQRLRAALTAAGRLVGEPTDERGRRALVQNIVNQLLEGVIECGAYALVDMKKRQVFNDTADEFVTRLLTAAGVAPQAPGYISESGREQPFHSIRAFFLREGLFGGREHHERVSRAGDMARKLISAMATAPRTPNARHDLDRMGICRKCGQGIRAQELLDGADRCAPRAPSMVDVFCDECSGPYTEMQWLMDQYGGHWDTCPNRAKVPRGATAPEPVHDEARIAEAKFKVDSRPHFHGATCLCGFASDRSRSRTEHITDALVAELTEGSGR